MSARKVVRSVATIVRAISSSNANTSSSLRSYRSDQMLRPSSAAESCAVMRKRSSAFRTVPSSTTDTPSRAPMARTS